MIHLLGEGKNSEVDEKADEQSLEKEFVSGSVDKTVTVWSCSKTSSGVDCSKVSKLTGKDKLT